MKKPAENAEKVLASWDRCDVEECVREKKQENSRNTIEFATFFLQTASRFHGDNRLKMPQSLGNDTAENFESNARVVTDNDKTI